MCIRDRVWNPDWAKYTYDRMFLRFCSPTKRISYAASFGVDKIPEKWVDKYKAGLIDFKALSVREDKAVDIVKNTIGITCHKVDVYKRQGCVIQMQMLHQKNL